MCVCVSRKRNVLSLKGIVSHDSFLGHLCISNDKSESDGSNRMTSELRIPTESLSTFLYPPKRSKA